MGVSKVEQLRDLSYEGKVSGQQFRDILLQCSDEATLRYAGSCYIDTVKNPMSSILEEYLFVSGDNSSPSAYSRYVHEMLIPGLEKALDLDGLFNILCVEDLLYYSRYSSGFVFHGYMDDPKVQSSLRGFKRLCERLKGVADFESNSHITGFDNTFDVFSRANTCNSIDLFFYYGIARKDEGLIYFHPKSVKNIYSYYPVNLLFSGTEIRLVGCTDEYALMEYIHYKDLTEMVNTSIEGLGVENLYVEESLLRRLVETGESKSWKIQRSPC